jgi:hypothetical protein
MKKLYIIPVYATLGALLGGLVYMAVYATRHTGSIGFDGPAGATLALSIVTASLAAGIGSLMYVVHHKYLPIGKALLLCLVSGIVACALLGYGFETGAMRLFPDQQHLIDVDCKDGLCAR